MKQRKTIFSNDTSFTEKLNYTFIFWVLRLGKSAYQRRVIATFLHWFYKLRRFGGFSIGFLFHIWTISIAYHEKGVRGATVTAILPFIAELYWLVVLFSTNASIFYFYLLGLIVSLVLFLAVLKAKKYDFSGTFWQ
jgi:hypothetical protein